MQNDLIPDYMKPLISLQLMNIPNEMREMQRRQHEHEMNMQQMKMQYDMMSAFLGNMNDSINSW